MSLKTIRTIFRFILRLIARVELINYDVLNQPGGYVAITNHIGRLDAILGMILPEREDVIMLVTDKYKNSLFWRYLVRYVDVIWLDRDEADFHAMRLVVKRLKRGEILGIAPEGTRSKGETLAEGKHGAAFLAAKARVPIIPTAITGTEDRVVKARLRRFRRLDIKIRVGKPFELPPLDRKNRDASLQANTDEIMCQIAALLPPKYRGVYADYPRVQELMTND